MSCDCPNPSPSIDCASPLEPCMGDLVKMYLGEAVDPTSGNLTLYTASTEDFAITYSLQPLIDAGVLPTAGTFASTQTASAYPLFTLTERELLSTSSYEMWSTYGSDRLTCSLPTFHSVVVEALGYDLDEYKTYGLKYTQDLLTNKQTDNSIIGYITSYFRKPKPNSIDLNRGLSQQEMNLLESKLIVCYQWLKQIYDSYYGKQFLVKVGQSPPSGTHAPFNGICIKTARPGGQAVDYDTGQYPNKTKPFVVDGDGSSQGLFLSDEVASDGGLQGKTNQLNSELYLIGLNLANDSAIFRTDDSRLQCFVRFGRLSTTDTSDSSTITKFGVQHNIDISKLSAENYVIGKRYYQDGLGGFFEEENLFVKANAANKIYVDDTGEWVLVTLSELVPLVQAQDISDYRQSLSIMQMLLGDGFRTLSENIISAVGGSSLIADNKSGALNNSTVLNTLGEINFTVFPQAFAIPMKSNILRYGPYYAGNDTSGGVEVIYEDILAPWNFIDVPSSGIYQGSLTAAYDLMDAVGQDMANAAIKDQLFLEKGKITVAGIPELNLADQYQKIGIPNNDAKSAEALLTDINISYGPGGFTTSYNFSSYTPRFGQPEKYIIDRWSESIKSVQHVSKYLREERSKVRHLSNTLKQNIATKQIASGLPPSGPKGKTSSTPNKLLFSGYYLSTSELFDENSDDDFNIIPDINVSDRPCFTCRQEPSLLPISSPSPPPSGNIYRQYTFAETHESYSDEYIQDTFYQLSVMSLDGLFLPVSLKGNPNPNTSICSEVIESDYRLPRFAMMQNAEGEFQEWELLDDKAIAGYPSYRQARNAMPPFKYQSDTNNVYNLPITQQYLNPMLSYVLLQSWDGRSNGSLAGFVISSIAFGCSFDKYQLTHTETDESEQLNGRQAQDNFRFSALRGPLVLQGWGYDTNGKPIPNKYDIPKKAEAGKFKKDGLADGFMEDWLANPKTWPVGPVDLRWDRERGVWTCASPNKIIIARLKEPLLPYGKATAELINPASNGIHFYKNFDISGPKGENLKESISSATIDVYDYLGVNLCECDVVYAYFDDNRYIVLETNKTYGAGGVCAPCTPTPCPSPTPSLSPSPSPSPSSCWCGLECLQTLQHYDPCKTQALIHKNGCLMWEDIVQCDPIQNAIEAEKERECRAILESI